MGIHALFYIYRSAKFGVVVFKASMLDCKGDSSTIGICALFYIDAKFGVAVSRHLDDCQVWCSSIQGIYA